MMFHRRTYRTRTGCNDGHHAGSIPDESCPTVALSVDGVAGVEKMFRRKTGLHTMFDLHLEVNPRITVLQATTSQPRPRKDKDDLEWVADVLVHIELPPQVRYWQNAQTIRRRPRSGNRKADQRALRRSPFILDGPTNELSFDGGRQPPPQRRASPHARPNIPKEEFLLITEGTRENPL